MREVQKMFIFADRRLVERLNEWAWLWLDRTWYCALDNVFCVRIVSCYSLLRESFPKLTFIRHQISPSRTIACRAWVRPDSGAKRPRSVSSGGDKSEGPWYTAPHRGGKMWSGSIWLSRPPDSPWSHHVTQVRECHKSRRRKRQVTPNLPRNEVPDRGLNYLRKRSIPDQSLVWNDQIGGTSNLGN